MATVNRFEDLRCWQEARVLTRKVYVYSQKGKLGKDWDAKSQFRRAALSVMNNIAEGFGRFSDREIKRFLEFSSSSANELCSMLYLFEDIGYLPFEDILELRALAEKTRSSILAFIRYLGKGKK